MQGEHSPETRVGSTRAEDGSGPQDLVPELVDIDPELADLIDMAPPEAVVAPVTEVRTTSAPVVADQVVPADPFDLELTELDGPDRSIGDFGDESVELSITALAPDLFSADPPLTFEPVAEATAVVVAEPPAPAVFDAGTVTRAPTDSRHETRTRTEPAILAPTPCMPTPSISLGSPRNTAPCIDAAPRSAPSAPRVTRWRIGAVAAVAAVLTAGIGIIATRSSGSHHATTSASTAVPARLDQYTNVVAQAARPIVDVYDQPGAPSPARSLENPTDVGSPLVFLVESEQGAWLKVRVPDQPNGATGWVMTNQVTLSRHDYRIVVSRSQHRLELYQGAHLELRAAIATGTRDFPEPGVYYVKELLKPPNADSIYGDFAFGLSGVTNGLDAFTKGDGVVAIHGTNDPASVGHDTVSGSIGLAAGDLRRLVGTLPLGTPVTVQP